MKKLRTNKQRQRRAMGIAYLNATSNSHTNLTFRWIAAKALQIVK